MILGIVQGVTEFLPVSSSGHLVLFGSWLGISETGILFEVLLHAATLGAVMVFFFPALRSLTIAKIGLLLLGTIPAAAVGLLLKSQIEVLFDSITLVAFALLITAAINLGIGYYAKRAQDKTVDRSSAVFIGLAQALAITPGISRSGSTILAGLSSGLSRTAAFEFSFLLSIPAIGGALLLLLRDVARAEAVLPPVAPMFVGFIAAFLTGLLSLGLLKKMLLGNHFILFSWYTASVAIGALILEFGL